MAPYGCDIRALAKHAHFSFLPLHPKDGEGRGGVTRIGLIMGRSLVKGTLVKGLNKSTGSQVDKCGYYLPVPAIMVYRILAQTSLAFASKKGISQ